MKIKDEDIYRIIQRKKERIKHISDQEYRLRYTRHMEGGERREFMQSIEDDKIIVAALEFYITNKTDL